jgi:hypothetical protein
MKTIAIAMLACLPFAAHPAASAQILSPPAASWSLTGHVGIISVDPDAIRYDYTLKVDGMSPDLDGKYLLVIKEDNYHDFQAILHQQFYSGHVTRITGMIFRVQDQRLLIIESIKDVSP